MEWVETTARTVDEAKESALDELGVVADEAEFEVLEEPRPGLFGRLRGEARVRARVRPSPVRPKQERRRTKRDRSATDAGTDAATATGTDDGRRAEPETDDVEGGEQRGTRAGGRRSSPRSVTAIDAATSTPPPPARGADMTADDVEPADRTDVAGEQPEVAIEDVRAAAEQFMGGLTSAFGLDAAVTSTVEGNEIEVRVDGDSLGLLIGPGGRTLLGIQDLARVAAQRRLGDHETRLRIDVAGYREKRQAALERFAESVAEQVRDSGVARSLDPMPSADRKVLHDALGALDGVTSRSEGEEPNRRIVVVPA